VQALATGFEPEIPRIASAKCIAGGPLGGDPVSAALPSRRGCRVATRWHGRAILAWLARSALAQEQAEWRGGRLQSHPGPRQDCAA